MGPAPFCFGKEYDSASTSCNGGLDLDYLDDEEKNLRPPCSFAAGCSAEMGDKKPTPAPWTDVALPQPTLRRVNLNEVRPSNPQLPERNPMFQQPVTAQVTMPHLVEAARPPQPGPAKGLPELNSPEWYAMINQLNDAGRRADEAAARNQQVTALPPIRVPAPIVTPPPVPPPVARPSFFERLQRPAQAIIQAAGPTGVPLAPVAPLGQPMPAVQPYPMAVNGGAATYQLNYALPGYLSAAEPRHPGESLWHVLGRELLRAVGKALGHALAHFFDTRVLRPA